MIEFLKYLKGIAFPIKVEANGLDIIPNKPFIGISKLQQEKLHKILSVNPIDYCYPTDVYDVIGKIITSISDAEILLFSDNENSECCENREKK